MSKNIIAIHTGVDSRGIKAVEADLAAKPPATWRVLRFKVIGDLLGALAGEAHIGKLEIVSEGSPIHLDGVDDGAIVDGNPDMIPEEFGAALKALSGLDANTLIFLSGCNTGCAPAWSELDDCLANRLARSMDMPVRGAKGYIFGAHALGNERTAPQHPKGGDIYKGSAKAKHIACWRIFNAGGASFNGTKARGYDADAERERFIGRHTIKLSPAFRKELEAAVDLTTRADTTLRDTPLRVGPDFRFSVSTSGAGRRTLEVIGNGRFLRDPSTRELWKFPSGPMVLEEVAKLLRR